VYYCPKCDKTLSKDRVEKTDRELRSMFGIDKLSALRCPVCGCEYIDLEKVRKGGEGHVGKAVQ
jgi:ssDNA-binding Zn-finger/Zn-ribbon topoisomerase 1